MENFEINIPRGSSVQKELLEPEQPRERIEYSLIVVEQYINEINFEKLKEVFVHKLKKYRSEKNLENFVPRERIAATAKKTGNGGTHNNYSKNIEINSRFIEEIGRAEIEERLTEFELLILATVTHEETHAVSYTRHEIQEDDKNFSFDQFSGIEIVKARAEKEEINDAILAKVKSETFMTFLNEAITEEFSKEVVAEYLSNEDRYSEEEKNRVLDQKAYRVNISFFNLLCLIIGDYTENDPETIKQAFYASYFQGENFLSADMKETFDAQIGPGFSKVLFMEEKEAKEYMRRVLDHLG
ncbi:MAG TPA: hypothetical protein VG621_01800 [Candidatus Paceibacterota bacterium]|nr:hypothetical protein [Candidatus Paceibacterota bacterium]